MLTCKCYLIVDKFMTHFSDQILSPDGGITDGDSQDLVNQYNHENINFMRCVDRLIFLKSINILLFLSKLHGGIGRVVIEANARGIPVVASNGRALPGLKKGECWIFTGIYFLKTVLSNLIGSPFFLERLKGSSTIRIRQFD